MDITIKNLENKAKFRYFWCKYITGFNLDHHCAKSFKGIYSKQFSGDLVSKDIMTLNEGPYEYIYICGVTSNFSWKDNLHIAIKFKAGSVVEINEHGVKMIIENAERIEIKHQDNYDLHARGGNKQYNTCRNWIFAYNTVFELN